MAKNIRASSITYIPQRTKKTENMVNLTNTHTHTDKLTYSQFSVDLNQ